MKIATVGRRPDGSLRRSGRVYLAAILGAIVLTVAISSCRKPVPASTSPSPQPANASQAEAAIPQPVKEQSCQDFVQGFYTWYVARDSANGKLRTAAPAWDDVVRLRPEALSPELLGLLKDDLAASEASPDEIVGLDWDPFLASQDPSSKFEVDSVSILGDRCNAWVEGIEKGRKRESVGPELIRSGETWAFVNFHYKGQPPPDENLISTLKVLRDERKKTIK
jgi:hypothetical protein